MKTPYAEAKENYLCSKEYHETVRLMLEKGFKQPYIENILIQAFTFGWNAKTDLLIHIQKQ